MDKFLIDELIELSENELSFCKIILSKYKRKWKIFLFLMLFLGVFSLGYFLIPFPTNLDKWQYLLIGIIFLGSSHFYFKAKTKYVVKKFYPEYYELNKKGKRWLMLQSIRLRLLEKKLKEKGLPKNYDFNLILSYLHYSSTLNKYNYAFTINFIVLVLGAFLGTFLSEIFDTTKNCGELIQTYKLISSIILMVFIIVFYFEIFILKDIILKFRNKHKILIQTIYYYSIKNQKK